MDMSSRRQYHVLSSHNPKEKSCLSPRPSVVVCSQSGGALQGRISNQKRRRLCFWAGFPRPLPYEDPVGSPTQISRFPVVVLLFPSTFQIGNHVEFPYREPHWLGPEMEPCFMFLHCLDAFGENTWAIFADNFKFLSLSLINGPKNVPHILLNSTSLRIFLTVLI